MKPSFPLAAVLAVALPCAAETLVLVAGGGSDTNTTTLLPAKSAQLDGPFGVDFDQSGNLYFVEMTGNRARKLDRSGRLAVIAGSGAKDFSGDGGPASKSELNGPHNLAVTPEGDIYIADTWNNRIRKISGQTSHITTIAGTGRKGFSGDGDAATKAEFGNLYCASLDPKREQLFLADLDNLRIRAVDLKTGRVRTVAGNGKKGLPQDGARAIEAPLLDPRAVAADGAGRIYVLERSGNALRVVETDGTIKTVAGTGQKGFSGDGGDARQATLNGPKHLCLDGEGNVLLADTENHVIRKYSPRDGTMVRVAGTGKRGTNGLNGPPLEAELNQPHGVYVHADGTLWIADSSNHRVLHIVK